MKLTHLMVFVLQASSQRQDNCGKFTPCSKETNLAAKAEEKAQKEQE